MSTPAEKQQLSLSAQALREETYGAHERLLAVTNETKELFARCNTKNELANQRIFEEIERSRTHEFAAHCFEVRLRKEKETTAAVQLDLDKCRGLLQFQQQAASQSTASTQTPPPPPQEQLLTSVLGMRTEPTIRVNSG